MISGLITTAASMPVDIGEIRFVFVKICYNFIFVFSQNSNSKHEDNRRQA